MPAKKHLLFALAVLTTFSSCARELFIGLHQGQDYSSEIPNHTQYIYVFSTNTVNVFAQVGVNGDTPPRKPDGSLDATATLVRIPILENAPYEIDGTTLTIDWSRNHTKYAPLSPAPNPPGGTTTTTEVFTIENGGFFLRSKTDPGIYLSEQT